ncbi:MAG TPA: hypothetical protein VEF33_09315 [Syntrophales bacterium]|nr:hypothetical protein [Syntrophales bacterium]
MRVSFTNDSNRHVIIDLAYLVTADRDTILRINNPNTVLADNYFESLIKFEAIDDSFLQKPNLPKELVPGEIWVTNIIEYFDLETYLKALKLQGIRRIPIGIMIRFINYKGTMFFASQANRYGLNEPVPFFTSEIIFHENGKTFITTTVHTPMEIDYSTE